MDFPAELYSRETWAAIIGAVIGGLLTGWFSLCAQKQAAKHQRRLALEAERRTVKNLLAAIRAELLVLKAHNLDPIQKTLKQRAAARANLPYASQLPPLAMIRIDQNYFTVFESNGGALGMIDDKNLLREIVTVYGLAKGLVDSLNTNARNFEFWRQTPENNLEKHFIAEMLLGLEQGLQNGLETLQSSLSLLVKKLEEGAN